MLTRTPPALQVCAECAKPFTKKPTGRTAKFCSPRCRQAAFRHGEIAAGALKTTGRYPPSPRDETPSKSTANSVTCEGGFGDRASLPKVIRPTFTGGRLVVSRDGVRAYVMRERSR